MSVLQNPLNAFQISRSSSPASFFQVQHTYRTLLSLYHKCIDNLRPGVPIRDVVQMAHRYLSEKSPGLEQYITKVSVVGSGWRGGEKAPYFLIFGS